LGLRFCFNDPCIVIHHHNMRPRALLDQSRDVGVSALYPSNPQCWGKETSEFKCDDHSHNSSPGFSPKAPAPPTLKDRFALLVEVERQRCVYVPALFPSHLTYVHLHNVPAPHRRRSPLIKQAGSLQHRHRQLVVKKKKKKLKLL